MRLRTSDSTLLAGRTLWPDSVAFREAIQHPSGVLSDPELQEAEIVLDRRGLPLTYSGRFAVVFRLRTTEGDWALRCFTQAAEGQERAERYRAIAARLQDLPDYFVPFRFLDRGIRIGTSWYPVVAMRWAQGETLGRFVERHIHDSAALQNLGASLSNLLARLESAGIAHGDWQHDNILVSENGRRVMLVDYDGMFVPELEGYEAPEIGHVNYQHPARSRAHFGVGLDRFAHLVMQTALRALCHDPSLWKQFSDGESLLFKRVDFDNPEGSALFRTLRDSPLDAEAREWATLLESACVAGDEGLLVSSPHIPTVCQRTLSQTSSKWWIEPEASQIVPRADLHKITFKSEYQEKLEASIFQDKEADFFWTVRALGSLSISTFLILMILTLTNAAQIDFASLINGPLPFFVIGGAYLGSTTYFRWPRHTVYQELVTEIGKMDEMIADRKQRIADESVNLPAVPDDLEEYLQTELEKIPVSSQVLRSLQRLSTLNMVGIKNTADLRGRLPVPHLSASENAALVRWLNKREAEAADKFPRLLAIRRRKDIIIGRLNDELGGFEARRAELEREKALFPPVTWNAFCDALLCREQKP